MILLYDVVLVFFLTGFITVLSDVSENTNNNIYFNFNINISTLFATEFENGGNQRKLNYTNLQINLRFP